jgi:hypothetical protein
MAYQVTCGLPMPTSRRSSYMSGVQSRSGGKEEVVGEAAEEEREDGAGETML